jgi:hypothetical protein
LHLCLRLSLLPGFFAFTLLAAHGPLYT